jgi:hypothetical protein
VGPTAGLWVSPFGTNRNQTVIPRSPSLHNLIIIPTELCRFQPLQTHSLTHSQALQPMQGLGRLKMSLPTVSVHGFDPPIRDSRPLCIPRHYIHPCKVWPSHSPSALRLVQGDFLAWQIILHSYYMSCPS